MNPEPLPGHEILTEPFLRQWGAVDGMKYNENKDGIFVLWSKNNKRDPSSLHLREYVFIAPIGTMAMVSTKLPEVRCECGANHHREATNPNEHDTRCPAHPRNRLVKVLPDLLARLKVKPEGLMWCSIGDVKDWSVCFLPWHPTEKERKYVFETDDVTYALPARVLAEIERSQEFRRIEASASISAGHEPECELSTTTSKEVKPCATQDQAPSAISSTADVPNRTNQQFGAKSATVVASNAAPPKSQPSEVAAKQIAQMVIDWIDGGTGTDWRPGLAEVIRLRMERLSIPATSPTDEEMMDWLEKNPNIKFEFHSTKVGLWHKDVLALFPNGFWRILFREKDATNRFSTLRLAIANAMKEGK